MAKKDNFDDVLGNKFSLVNAKSSKLLSSWMSNAPPTPSTTKAPEDTQDDDSDLKQSDFGHDRLGVGHAVPKDIADGTFTRRAPTSNDKLLEQLIGKKRAKAHLAAKQEAERASARQQPAWQQKKEEKKLEESDDDDDESRAAVITSKRRKAQTEKKSEAVISNEGKGDVKQAEEVERDAEPAREKEMEESVQTAKDESDEDIDLKPKKRVKKSRAKPTSYLDELLASRSAKKKKATGTGEN